MTTESTAYDVIAVSLKDNSTRVISTNKSLRNAEAIRDMAVIRRGVEEEFFVEVPAGKYDDGDQYLPEPSL